MRTIIKHFRPLAYLAAAGALLASSSGYAQVGGVQSKVMSSSPILAAQPAASQAPAVIKPEGAVAALLNGPAASAPAVNPQSAFAELGSRIPRTHLPYPLRPRSLPDAGVIYLSLPTEQDVRLMLPGQALDAAAAVRRDVSKFFTDALGVAAQTKIRALDSFSTWLDMTDRQAAGIPPTEDWTNYIFTGITVESVTAFRDDYSTQAKTVLERTSAQIPDVVARISRLMNAAQGYPQQKAWYEVMVQLRESFKLYQTQVLEGDAQVAAVANDYLAKHPVPPRPEGRPPLLDLTDKPIGRPAVSAPAPVNPEFVRTPAKQVEEAAPTIKKESESGLLGGLIVLGMLAAVVFFFVRLRKKGPVAPV